MWEHAISTGTAKTYDTALKTFKRFCSISGEQSLPHKLPTLSEELLIRFVIFCFNSMSLKHATIKIYLSGIRFHYIESGAKFLSEPGEIPVFLACPDVDPMHSPKIGYSLCSQ